jgi:hypothetical protein
MVGQLRHATLGAREQLEHVAAGGIGERGKDGIKRMTRILNHMVKYYRLAFVYASNYFQYCEPSISTHFAIQFIIS